jgi:hypothetical protein
MQFLTESSEFIVLIITLIFWIGVFLSLNIIDNKLIKLEKED